MISCNRVQAALSARLDGEPYPDPELDDDVIDAHVSGCAQCQAFMDNAAALNRQLQLADAAAAQQPAPDLSAAILSGIEPEFRRVAASRAWNLALSRVLLVVVGLLFAAWGVRMLIDGALAGGPSILAGEGPDHAQQVLLADAAAMRIALAFGLFFAAWRPRATGPLVPVYGAYFMFSCGFFSRDVIVGTATAGQGWSLVLLLSATLVLLWSYMAGFGLAAFSRAWRALRAESF